MARKLRPLHTKPTGRSCTHWNYRMSCEDYDALLRRARHRCEICRKRGEDTTHGFLCIDHDAAVAQWAVRGLLCSSCNTQLDYPYFVGKAPRASVYLAAPWYVTMLGKRGLTAELPPEPPVGTAVRVAKSGVWRRTPEGWCRSRYLRTWRHLHRRNGPHNISIIAA